MTLLLRTAAIFAAISCLLASRSEAQSIVIVPPLAGDGVAVADVQAAASRWLASHDRRVVPLAAPLIRELEPCLTGVQSMPPGCAFDYHKRAEADQTLVAWVERDRAIVAIIIEHGLYYSGHARDGSWQVALDKALADARRRETRGLGPWLELSGFPGDAKVVVDGQEVGRLRGPPVRLTEGGHQVEVHAEGYETTYELVNVPTATSYAAVNVELVTASKGASVATQAQGSPSPNAPLSAGPREQLRAVRPITLIGVGAALTLLGGVVLVHGAVDNDRVNKPTILFGSAAALSGVGLLSAGIYLHVHASRESASVSVTTSF